MVYDWSVGFTHQYFGVSLDYAGGAVTTSNPVTTEKIYLRFELSLIFIKLFKKR